MAVTVFIRNDNIAASAKTVNRLADTDLSLMPYDGSVNVYAVSSAAGVNVEFGVANQKAISDREIPFIGTTIDRSAHDMLSFNAAAGSPLSYFQRETTGAATTDILTIVEAVSFEE